MGISVGEHNIDATSEIFFESHKKKIERMDKWDKNPFKGVFKVKTLKSRKIGGPNTYKFEIIQKAVNCGECEVKRSNHKCRWKCCKDCCKALNKVPCKAHGRAKKGSKDGKKNEDQAEVEQ